MPNIPVWAIFLHWKMTHNRKMNQSEITGSIRTGGLSLPPLSVEFSPESDPKGPEARVDISWNGSSYRFAAEIKARSNPRTLLNAVEQALRMASPPETLPLVIVPYLTEDQLQELEARGVSGLDLNGNGVVVVPERLLVFRTGKPNRYRESVPLRNIYRGKVSIAARVFLLRARYDAVNEIREEIETRGTTLAISTVSKVLSGLEDDLIVTRERGSIELVQPRKLLGALTGEYEPPRIRRTVTGKTPLSPARLTQTVAETVGRNALRVVVTGASSTPEYAVMAREERTSFYTTDARELLERVESPTGLEETPRFTNVEFLETADETVYFDARPLDAGIWASPIQTYLELMAGDKRDRETAEQVAESLLASEVKS